MRKMGEHGTAALVLAVGTAVGLSTPSRADDNLTIIQMFEQPHRNLENRVPDVFVSGYNALWFPPAHRGASLASVGYDTFDRFDFGEPGDPTAYGTEADFRAMIAAVQRGAIEFHLDTVVNHNSPRNGSQGFQAFGGWPGFILGPGTASFDLGPDDDWGDFYGGINGLFRDAATFGQPNSDAFRGDLVSLIDINLGPEVDGFEVNNNFLIRHPIEAGDPLNVPAGFGVNQPDPANSRFYPDLDLPPVEVTQFVPGRSGGGTRTVFVHPFNLDDPAAGDPVPEFPAELMGRWAQYMLEEFGVDGFRLDAARHVFPAFWDKFWDTAVFNRRRMPDGTLGTPFSYTETTLSPSEVVDGFTRLDGIGNRSALDLSASGALRGLVEGGGFGDWGNVLSAHYDVADDGFQNGSVGVNHVFSHDDGSVGTGTSQPPIPSIEEQGLFAQAYVLWRPGPALVYHNARGISFFGSRFWPREGVPVALGLDPLTGAADDRVQRLVRIRHEHARGEFFQLNEDISDVLAFEMRSPGFGPGNAVFGVNDRGDEGFDSVPVTVAFPAGTVLVELTGNAADPAVDPFDEIPELITVGAGGSIELRVPRAESSAGRHDRAYIAYGPAVPDAELGIVGASGVLPPDPASVPTPARRLTPVTIVSGETFELSVTTRQAVAEDPGVDDNAIFRINQGFIDANGNGGVDIPASGGVADGFEFFETQNSPLSGGGVLTGEGPVGVYRQVIDTSALPEGMNYITVRAFRQRDAGSPLFRELREVIYNDTEPPAIGVDITDPQTGFFTVTVDALDETTTAVAVAFDAPAGATPEELLVSDAAIRQDRFRWTRGFINAPDGPRTITVVATEITGNTTVETFPIQIGACLADIDLNETLDAGDVLAVVSDVLAGAAEGDVDGDGATDVFDLLEFLAVFDEGCVF